MRKLLLVATLTAVTPWAVAQRTSSRASHFTAPVAAPAHPDASAGLIRGLMSRPNSEGFRRFHPSSSFPLLSAFGSFSDSFYPNDSSAADSSTPGYPPAGQAPNILLQALSPAGATQDQQQPPSQPLLIELQGGRYVRLTGDNKSDGALAYQAPAAPVTHASAKVNSNKGLTHEVTARVLAPVVLVFRDGHSEEVRDYTIAGGAIYARGDYYADGYWNKKIELSALDLPETIKSNQERGVRFALPGAPNEVITRP
jgi:hypothetical protein